MSTCALLDPEIATEADPGVVCALLFADVRGFSRIADDRLPGFARHVLGAFADVLARHDALSRNTWGDALHAVFADAGDAADCALELQEAMAGLDTAALGLPADLALRVAGHVGRVYPTFDAVLGRRGFLGASVSRTARIEPVTPPGAVWVTAPFTLGLRRAGRHDLACDPVGHVAAAKGYGSVEMYRMRRA